MTAFFATPWLANVIALLALLLTIAMGLTGYFSRKHARKGKQIRFFSLTSYPLGQQEKSIPDRVKVLFDDRPIPRITRTVIVIWNGGADVIRAQDVTTSDPLRVEVVGDGEILVAEIVKQTRPGINAHLLTSPTGVSCGLNFDFLDPADGLRITLLHTSKTPELRLAGTVMGMLRGPQRTPQVRGLGPLTLLISPALALILAALSAWLISIFDVPSILTVVLPAVVFVAVLYTVFAPIADRLDWKMYPKSLD